MYGNLPNTGLTIGKIFGGISKSLNIVNQIIPIYREVKPVINNAKNVLGVLKDFNSPKSSLINNQKKMSQKLRTSLIIIPFSLIDVTF